MEILLLACAILIIPLWLLPWLSLLQHEKSLRMLATRMGWSYSAARHSLFGRGVPATVRGNGRNRSITIDIERRYRFSSFRRRIVQTYHFRHIAVEIENPNFFYLSMLSAAQGSVLAMRLSGRKTIKTGNEAFDHRFYIESSNPNDLASKLFSSNRIRSDLMENLQGVRPYTLRLNGQHLQLEENLFLYRFENKAHEVEYLRHMCEVMIDLAEIAETLTR